MSTIRVTAMQYVEARLREWGNWSNGHLNHLDYASKTLLANLKEYGHMPLTKYKRTLEQEQSNPSAEEIEGFIVKLSVSETDMVKVLRIHYCKKIPIMEKLRMLGMSLPSFRRGINSGKHRVAGYLWQDIHYYCS